MSPLCAHSSLACSERAVPSPASRPAMAAHRAVCSPNRSFVPEQTVYPLPAAPPRQSQPQHSRLCFKGQQLLRFGNLPSRATYFPMRDAGQGANISSVTAPLGHTWTAAAFSACSGAQQPEEGHGVPHAVPVTGSRPGKGRSESQTQQKQGFCLPANTELPLLYRLESYNLPWHRPELNTCF